MPTRRTKKSKKAAGQRPSDERARHIWTDRPWFWPVVVAAVALVLRVVYVLQVVDTPFFQTLGLDAKFYDRTAWSMLNGEGVEGAYFMSPLYSWFLAGLYRLFGRDLLIVRLVQSVVGAGSAVLTYRLADRIFDRRVALLSGFIAASYGAFIFYDGSVLMTPLLVFLSLLALYLLVEGAVRRHPLLILFSGAAIGLAAIGRASALVFTPVAALWLLFSPPRQEETEGRVVRPLRRPLHLALLLIAGVAIVVAPVTIRNVVASGDPVLITSNGGLNFYIGNSEIATGGYEKPAGLDIVSDPDGELIAEADAGRDLSPSEVSSYWYARARRYIAENPGAWASLLTRKLAFVMSSYELPQLENYYFQRRYSQLLSTPLPGFAVVAPLGLVGLVLAWKRRRARILLYFFAVYILTIVAFFVVSRYRLPAVPALIIGAAYAVVYFVERARELRWRSMVVPVLAVLALAVVVNANLYGIDRNRGFAQSHYRLGIIYGEQGETERAIREYEQAISIDPAYAKSYLNLGALLAEQGENEQAADVFRRAIRLDPEYADARINLAIILERRGMYDEALAQIDTVLTHDPGSARALKERGIALYRTGRRDEARETFERALAADATGREGPEIRFYLGVLQGRGGELSPQAVELMQEAEALVQVGRIQDALARLEEAAEAAPNSGEPLRRMASIKHGMGLVEEATQLVERALRVDPATPHAHFLLGVLLNEQMEHDRAVVAYEAEIRLNEDFAPPHLNLGLTYQYHLGNPNKALYHYRRYLELGGARRAEVEQLISSLNLEPSRR
ncbi:MAG: tetratricopeptide repeat protein [Candidatus Eisenbacteria bacterium]|nr:tetratricopeptide repeat protein [Candidatus Eisenbacteria bacterium]